MTDIEQIEIFLKEDEKRAIDVLSKGDVKHYQKLDYKQVEQHGGLEEMLKNIKTENPDVATSFVYSYLPNGTTNGGFKNYRLKSKVPLAVTYNELSLGNDKEAVKSTVTKSVAVPPAQPFQNQQPMNGLPNYENNAVEFNSGMIGVQMKAFDYERLKRELDTCEKKHEKEVGKLEKNHEKEVKKLEKAIEKLERKYDKADDDNRDLKSRTSNFVKELELTQKLADANANKTGAADILKSLVESAKEFAPSLIASSVNQAQASGLNAPNLSEIKTGFISFIAEESITDEQVQYFQAMVYAMHGDKDFRNKAVQLMVDNNKVNQS